MSFFTNDKFITIAITGLFTLGQLIYVYYKRKNKKLDRTKLQNHYLFTNLRAWIIDVDSINFINQYKTLIGRDIAKIKLKIGFKMLYDFAIRFDEGKIEKVEYEFSKTIKDLIANYRQQFVDEGIPIEVIEEFCDFHSKNTKVLMDLCSTEFQNYHKNDFEKLYSVFNNLRAVYLMMLSHLQYVINKANGRLYNKTYKGVKNTNEHIIYKSFFKERKD